MDMRFLYAALAIMLIIFAREFLRKKFNIDIDNININKLKSALKPNNKDAVIKTTGTKSLVLVDCGVNKATVMATLRQLTGLDYAAAKNIVESAPAVFMSNISEKEADMNKKALEYVGAKVEIK